MEERKPILSLKDIMKIYPGVVALNKVSIDFYPGEVHALIGENGAGKSTFIKTITGAHAPDGGTITIDGETHSAMTPGLARKYGVECIYQEFNLIDVLSAAENICYGERYGKLVNQKKMCEIAQKIFDRHTLLRELLIRLGVDTKTAAEDACKMEHAISDASFEAIKAYVRLCGEKN